MIMLNSFEMNMNKCLNEINESWSTVIKQMQDDVNEIRNRKESKRDTGKSNENNNNGVSLSANQVTVDKVSNGVNHNDDNDSE